MMEKGKSKWVAGISILVAVVIGAAGYFLYRYYQARRIFEENARTVCGEVEELIAEEKFQEASDKISETEKKFIDYGRSQLTNVFLSQLQMVEDNAGDYRKADVMIDLIIKNLANYPKTAESIVSELNIIANLTFSEYDRRAYGIQDYIKSVYNFGIIIGNFLQSDYTQSNLNNLKDQLRNNIVEWTDIKLEAIDSMERISSVLEKLPNF